jgi:hypothetical protein
MDGGRGPLFRRLGENSSSGEAAHFRRFEGGGQERRERRMLPSPFTAICFATRRRTRLFARLGSASFRAALVTAAFGSGVFSFVQTTRRRARVLLSIYSWIVHCASSTGASARSDKTPAPPSTRRLSASSWASLVFGRRGFRGAGPARDRAPQRDKRGAVKYRRFERPARLVVPASLGRFYPLLLSREYADQSINARITRRCTIYCAKPALTARYLCCPGEGRQHCYDLSRGRSIFSRLLRPTSGLGVT